MVKVKSEDRVARARIRLRHAIDRACCARGEAAWTNGYRAAKFGGRVSGGTEEDRMYAKECAQWDLVTKAEASVERAIRAYAAAIRKAR